MRLLTRITILALAFFVPLVASATVSLDYVPDTYSCDGVITTYGYTFQIYEDDDLIVYVEASSGDQTTLTLNTDYTVTGAGTLPGAILC